MNPMFAMVQSVEDDTQIHVYEEWTPTWYRKFVLTEKGKEILREGPNLLGMVPLVKSPQLPEILQEPVPTESNPAGAARSAEKS